MQLTTPVRGREERSDSIDGRRMRLPVDELATSGVDGPTRADGNGESAALSSHRHAVERVIRVMEQRLDEPLTLPEMARIANFSPFHFDRVFHRMTVSPPLRFLAALRIEAAKRLLITSTLSVTDICFEVGYNSLGTFSSHFSRVVGVSPIAFRHRKPELESSTMCYVEFLQRSSGNESRRAPEEPGWCGWLTAPRGFSGLVFIGLFHQPYASGQPEACTLSMASGPFRLPSIADGMYYLLAAGCPWPDTFPDLLFPKAPGLLVAVGDGPIVVADGRVHGSPDLFLRPYQSADPPLLTSLPLLLHMHRLHDVDRGTHRASVPRRGDADGPRRPSTSLSDSDVRPEE